MKKRTEAIAGLLVLCCGFNFFVLACTAIGGVWKVALSALPFGLQFPFWIGLIFKRAWAWYTLIVILSLTLIQAVVYIGRMPGYYFNHATWRPLLPSMLTLDFAWLTILVILPLIFLLTDRPGGWANPQSEIRNPK